MTGGNKGRVEQVDEVIVGVIRSQGRSAHPLSVHPSSCPSPLPSRS